MLKELCNESYRSANSETCVSLAAVFVSSRNAPSQEKREGRSAVKLDEWLDTWPASPSQPFLSRHATLLPGRRGRGGALRDYTKRLWELPPNRVTHEFKKKKQLLKPRIEGINITAKERRHGWTNLKIETDAFFFINTLIPTMCGVKTMEAWIVVVLPGRKSIRPMTNSTLQHGLSKIFFS